MKRILAVVLVSTLFTGCAQLQDGARRYMTSPAELAVEDCNKMGFKPGTQSFQNCVLTTSQSIRNARAQQAAASEAARISASQQQIIQPVQVNQGYRNYDCRSRLGGRVECTGY